MPITDGFVTAVGPDGKKRRVPEHYLQNKRLGFRLPPSQRKTQPKARKESPTPDSPSSREADDTTKETD